MPRSPLLNIKDLSVSLSDEPLFAGLSFSVGPGELVALVGANGCGKSTLFNLVMAQAAGESFRSDDTTFNVSGSISLSPGTKLEYLPQVITDAVSESSVEAPFRGADYAKRCREFEVTESARSFGQLSGGEIQKRALAKVFTTDGDLYLLDEPTNYLDIAGITAFEHHIERLKNKAKGIVLVTHDRTLTDNLADKTVLLSRHGIYVTSGGASAAAMLEAGEFESRRHQAKDISRKIEKLQADATAKAGWSATSEKRKIGAGSSKPTLAKLSKRMAKRVKAVEKRVDREAERLAKTKPFVPKRLNLSFPKYEVRNRDVFRLEHVRFGYESGDLFSDLSFAASTRDRLCLMGINGCGKTTMLRLMRQTIKPDSGEAYLNRSVKVAYISQGLDEFFDEEILLDNYRDCDLSESTIRQHLGSALIRKEKAREPISDFSRGELMRAAVTKCVLMRAEFLLLDEPTSNLDIESIEVLERLLGQFQGGFVIISHDRSFVANVADKLYLLDKGEVRLI